MIAFEDFRSALASQLRFLSVSLALLIIWIGAVIVWPLGPRAEGSFLPVVENIVITRVSPVEGGAAFYVSFDKIRQCDFDGMTWYLDDVRLLYDFEPDASKNLPTRPTGSQFTGPWIVYGVSSLDGVVSTVVHKCHPFWTTYTHFYPPPRVNSSPSDG